MLTVKCKCGEEITFAIEMAIMTKFCPGCGAIVEVRDGEVSITERQTSPEPAAPSYPRPPEKPSVSRTPERGPARMEPPHKAPEPPRPPQAPAVTPESLREPETPSEDFELLPEETGQVTPGPQKKVAQPQPPPSGPQPYAASPGQTPTGYPGPPPYRPPQPPRPPRPPLQHRPYGTTPPTEPYPPPSEKKRKQTSSAGCVFAVAAAILIIVLIIFAAAYQETGTTDRSERAAVQSARMQEEYESMVEVRNLTVRRLSAGMDFATISFKVKNTGDYTITDLSIDVKFLNARGETIDSRNVSVTGTFEQGKSRVLEPGKEYDVEESFVPIPDGWSGECRHEITDLRHAGMR